MNLVAKEFVAAREDLGGVLVFSEMTGAAHELTDAVLMNPYHVDGFAQAIEPRDRHADPMERTLRMRSLRRVVAGRDVLPLGVAHPRSPRGSGAGRPGLMSPGAAAAAQPKPRCGGLPSSASNVRG